MCVVGVESWARIGLKFYFLDQDSLGRKGVVVERNEDIMEISFKLQHNQVQVDSRFSLALEKLM